MAQHGQRFCIEGDSSSSHWRLHARSNATAASAANAAEATAEVPTGPGTTDDDWLVAGASAGQEDNVGAVAAVSQKNAERAALPDHKYILVTTQEQLASACDVLSSPSIRVMAFDCEGFLPADTDGDVDRPCRLSLLQIAHDEQGPPYIFDLLELARGLVGWVVGTSAALAVVNGKILQTLLCFLLSLTQVCGPYVSVMVALPLWPMLQFEQIQRRPGWVTCLELLVMLVALFVGTTKIRGRLVTRETEDLPIVAWLLDFALLIGVAKFGLQGMLCCLLYTSPSPRD